MPSISLPDGSSRDLEDGATGADLALSISKSLAKKAVAVTIDGELSDLSDTLTEGSTVEIVTRDDERALELIRHDTAHVMAEAVQELWPGTQVTIGPVIENGFFYDFYREEPFTTEDLPVIEKKMREIIARNKPFTKEVWSRDKTAEVFKEKGEDFKVELLDAIPDGEDVKIYYQGDWFDLCRGPHMPSTGQIGSAFKLMKVAGAYWRGDSNNQMLTRIYGTAWADEKGLKNHLTMLEEAEKRDHRKLGREMDLFHFQEEGPGTVFWHPKGWRLFQNLTDYMRRRIAKDGYKEVNTPLILDKSLWETSGHWGWYQENMFGVKSAHTLTNPNDPEADDRFFALKPMNCPGHVEIFKHGLKSYRDLPLRMAEFGVVHRYEASGALHGLLRVRAFTQDDAHVFCTQDQLESEILKINDLMMSVYDDFGFEEVEVKLATRPEKRVGTDEAWDHAEDILKRSLERIAEQDPRISIGINEGEGTFYGPKFEYTLKDAIGRDWQLGTTQVDFNLPERFGSFYVDRDGDKVQPVMIHRAVCGSLERFLGILIESYAGSFPLWLAPVQVVVATITADADAYAREVHQALLDAGFEADLDARNEKINYKVREHSLQKVPVIMVVGNREAEERSVNIRRFGTKHGVAMSLDEALTSLGEEATPPDVLRARG